jgi:hypothetical protein
MDIKEQILLALGLNKVNSLKLEWQTKTEDGTILVSTADELAAGVDISVLTEDGTTIPLPIGTYKTAEGVSFVVEEEGIVAEVMETEDEEEVTEEETTEEELGEDKKKKYADGDEADVEDWAGMEKRIANLEDAIADLKGKVDGGGDEEAEEMETEKRGTTPKTVKTTEVKEFSIDELKAENLKLKKELGSLPATAPINAHKFQNTKRKVGITKDEYKNLSSSDKFLYDISK